MAADGTVGKREFVRALSVDEGDSGITIPKVGGGANANGGGGAGNVDGGVRRSGSKKSVGDATVMDVEQPAVDLRYTRYVPEVQPSGWWEPSAEHLNVRGAGYLKDRKKTKSLPAVFECVTVETFQVHKPLKKIAHMATRQESQFKNIVKKAPPDTPYVGAPGSKFTFVVHFQAPGYGVCMYFQRKATEKLGSPGGGEAFERAFRAFLEGDEEYKRRHLKFFPVVTEGSWIVRKVVGGKPAIIAKKIDCVFYEGENYFEVNVDVSSSSVAKNILKVVKSYAKKVTFDLAWGFEGKTIEHLPERIMGITRFSHVNVDMLPIFPGTALDEAEALAAKSKK